MFFEKNPTTSLHPAKEKADIGQGIMWDEWHLNVFSGFLESNQS
jgi:hypothetical protein